MTWLDEQNFEARIRRLRNRGRYQLPLNLNVAERLVREARKFERVRKSVKRRMEQDEYDQIIDDIHEIIGNNE